jgi:hypothetical protein
VTPLGSLGQHRFSCTAAAGSARAPTDRSPEAAGEAGSGTVSGSMLTCIVPRPVAVIIYASVSEYGPRRFGVPLSELAVPRPVKVCDANSQDDSNGVLAGLRYVVSLTDLNTAVEQILGKAA